MFDHKRYPNLSIDLEKHHGNVFGIMQTALGLITKEVSSDEAEVLRQEMTANILAAQKRTLERWMNVR